MELGERIKETVMEHFFPYRLHEYDQAVQAILAAVKDCLPNSLKADMAWAKGYNAAIKDMSNALGRTKTE